VELGRNIKLNNIDGNNNNNNNNNNNVALSQSLSRRQTDSPLENADNSMIIT
jgi:hypothetical protein